jgi:hypothetical protein
VAGLKIVTMLMSSFGQWLQEAFGLNQSYGDYQILGGLG